MTNPSAPFQCDTLWFDSTVLRTNPLGDPYQRAVYILSPAGTSATDQLPMIWMLAAFTSTGASFLNFAPWQENLLQRVSRLEHEHQLAPVRFALPDVFTRYGGSQFVDSPAIGDYDTYLWKELLPFVESHYPTGLRGVAGKSSGGFGAWWASIQHPDLFAGLACHSGDMGFNWCYLPDLPKLAGVLRQYGDVETFWHTFHHRPKKSSTWITAMNLLAMAAAYSPNPGHPPLNLELPIDPFTLELKPEIWSQWCRFDPLELADRAEVTASLHAMRYLFFDAGDFDEFNLQYGARRLHQKLLAANVPHHFETFPDGHFQTHYRYDYSLPGLSQALQGF